MEHHVHVSLCLKFKLMLVWMNACEESLNFSTQLGLQKFYSNTRFQMLNFKYFCRILQPLNGATKVLENSKMAVLFFFLWQICKSFLIDSCWKMFLVILSSSRKSFVNFWAWKHLRFNFQSWTISFSRTSPRVSLHLSLLPCLLAISLGSRGGAPRRPLLADPVWPWPGRQDVRLLASLLL